MGRDRVRAGGCLPLPHAGVWIGWFGRVLGPLACLRSSRIWSKEIALWTPPPTPTRPPQLSPGLPDIRLCSGVRQPGSSLLSCGPASITLPVQWGASLWPKGLLNFNAGPLAWHTAGTRKERGRRQDVHDRSPGPRVEESLALSPLGHGEQGDAGPYPPA